MQVRAFFNHSALTYSQHINLWITRKRATFIQSVARGRILDVGVGPGQLAQLYSSGPTVYCDAALNMLKLAQERLPQGSFVVSDAEHSPFKDACFDTVIASELIYYLRDPCDFLREVLRILKPNGQLILLWGNPMFHVMYGWASMFGLRPTDPHGFPPPSSQQIGEMLSSNFPHYRFEFYGIGLPWVQNKCTTELLRKMSPVNAVVACPV